MEITNFNKLQTGFLLDEKLIIRFANPGIANKLRWKVDNMIGKPFAVFIKDLSKTWKAIDMLFQKEDLKEVIKIDFYTGKGQIIPLYGYFSCMFGSFTTSPYRKIFIISFKVPHLQKLNGALTHNIRKGTQGLILYRDNRRIVLSTPDIKSINKVRNYILKNLEADFPSIKFLAQRFKINEFKLKNGFKAIYGNTIFRFFTQQRLEKSEFLLQNTDMKIYEIARTTGFKSTPSFSKLFKKKYGYPPNAYKYLTPE